MAAQLAVHQEVALDVSVEAHQLLELLRGEGVRQVGEAEQRVGRLQGDVDQASSDSAVVEGADGILSLVPVQQSHKGWRWGGVWGGHYGDSDEGTGPNTHQKNKIKIKKKHRPQVEMKINKNIHLKHTQKATGRHDKKIKKHAQKHMENIKSMTSQMW